MRIKKLFFKYSSRNRVKIFQISLTKGPYQWPPHIKVCLFHPTHTHIFVIMQHDSDACTDANRDITDQSSSAWRLLRTSSVWLRPTSMQPEQSCTLLFWASSGPFSKNEKPELTIILCCLDKWWCVSWFASKFDFGFQGHFAWHRFETKKKKTPAKIAVRVSGGKRAEWWHNHLKCHTHSDAACESPLWCRSKRLCSLLFGETWHLADNTTFNLSWFVPQKLWGEMILASWLLPLFPPRQIRDSLLGVSWMIHVETGERLWQPNTKPSSLCSHPAYSRSCN